jgi:hypothetical protein
MDEPFKEETMQKDKMARFKEYLMIVGRNVNFNFILE